jgi:hypothetical protein
MGNVRIINSKGQVKFVPEGITKASWFIKSDWQVQDLKVSEGEDKQTIDSINNTKKTPKNKKQNGD